MKTKHLPAVRVVEGQFISAKEAAFIGGVSLLSCFSMAHAVLDVSDVTDAISAAGTAAGVIGLAVVVMVVGIKVFHWIRRAL